MKKCRTQVTMTATDYWITTHPLRLPSSKYYRKGVRLVSVVTRKGHARAAMPQAKCSDYLSGVLSTIELTLRDEGKGGLQEALFLDSSGYVQEGRTNNLFIVKGRMLITPPSYGILGGVTRRTVIELCEHGPLRIKECELTRHDVYTAEEAFLTYTSGGLIPILELDGRKIGGTCPGSVTKLLTAEYRKMVRCYVSENKSASGK